MGRGKIEIKRIENKTNQQVTFSKRRKGLLKKAHELAVLCDAQVGLVIFSCTGKMFEFSSQDTSLAQVIDRYQRTTNICIEEIDYQQQLVCEMTRMKSDHDRLQAWMRQYLGEDLSYLNMHELDQLLGKLDCAVKKIQSRKEELSHQQVENCCRRGHILEEQNNHFHQMLSLQQAAMERHHAAAMEHRPGEIPIFDHYGQFYHDEPGRSMLQLLPQLPDFSLQPPVQPNLQEASFSGHGHGHGLQLW